MSNPLLHARACLLGSDLVGFAVNRRSGALDRVGAAKVGAAITATAPASVKVTINKPTAVTGISVSDTTGAPSETVTLSDTNGLLSASGAAGVVSGSNTTHLVLTGTLAQVNAALATLTDTDSVAAADTIGTSVVDSYGSGAFRNTAVTVACYLRGTMIATPSGEQPIETLAIGDLVLTASGAAEPIRWIGHRAYQPRFIRAHREVHPVRFQADALADGVPRRDLLVSPLHAMAIDGVLVPAIDLVNGTTIVQDTATEIVEYFHIELNQHAVILAEGAPSESFVDDDSRMMFHNAHDFAVRYPDAAVAEARYCAPRVQQGYALDAIRQRLADRAAGRERCAA